MNRVTNPKTSPSPEARGFRRSKGQRKQDEGVVRLEKKLLQSRQQVVQHLKHSRKIEESILQAELIEQQRREQVKAAQVASSRKNVASSIKTDYKRRGSLAVQSSLPPSLLRSIEDAHNLEFGHGEAVQKALNIYDDMMMVDHMEKVPKSALQNLDKNFFAKVATMTSKSLVNKSEASALYADAETLMDLKSNTELANVDKNEVTWDVLIRLLRRKLLIAKLAISLYEGDKTVLPNGAKYATTHSSMFSSRLGESKSMIESKSLPSLSHNQSESDLTSPAAAGGEGGGVLLGSVSAESSMTLNLSMSASGNIDGGSPTLDSEGIKSPRGDPGSPTRYMSLKSTFHKSQSRQVDLSDKIVSNITKVSKAVTVDAEKHPSAAEFARRIVIRKLQGIVADTVRRLQRKGLQQWMRVTEVHRLQEVVKLCLRAFAVYKFHYFVEKQSGDEQSRMMNTWKRRIQWYRDAEQTAAAGELQRHWRGALDRKRLLWKEKNLAVVFIQKRARGTLGRDYFQKFRTHKHREHCARRIEGAYMKYRWRRIRKNIQVFKKQKMSAGNIQRVYRGFHGRERVRAKILRKRQEVAALRFQCLFRRYTATLVVDRKLRLLIRKKCCVQMQKRMRGVLTRKLTNVMLRDFRAARMIQCMVRSRLARSRVSRVRRTRAATRIQKVHRGGVARFFAAEKKRKYLVWKKKRQDAIDVMSHLILGYAARRKWLPLIASYTALMKKCAIIAQCSIRVFVACRRVKHLRRLRDDEELRRQIAEQEAAEQAQRELVATLLIQRVVRGFLGRRKAFLRAIQREHDELLRAARIPAYYRIKEDYFKSQNMLHKALVIKIQCAYRTMLSKRAMHKKKRKRAVRRIEKFYRSCLQMRDAKAELARRREIWRQKNFAATQMQRIVRGFMGRYEFKKHERAEIIKWFIEEVHSLGMVGRALQNFRVRKRTMEKLERGMTLLQALVRRFLTRCKFIRGYKRLVRERDTRRKKRRIKACVKIQGFARIIRANNAVIRRKAQIEEEERKKAEMEDLENKIDGIHSDHMTDLMATRIETKARGLLGKKDYSKKEEEVKRQKDKDEAAAKAKAATQIQALIRGCQSRVKFRERAATLRAERKKRSFCVECEANVATKKCRQCKDRYCDTCFLTIHKKGTRRKHNWEPVSGDSIMHAHAEDGDATRTDSAKGTARERKKPLVNKKDWERFYDDTAKAYYWFNAASGEARWTDPMK